MKFATLFRFSFIIYVLIFTTSCGINRKYKTPEKPSVYPVFTIKDSLKGYNYFQRICYDVTHYDIHLSFNIDKKSIQGFVETTFSLDKNSSEIQVDLDEQFIIDSITQNNKKLDYKRVYTAIFISLNSTNKQQQVKIYYHGVPKKAKKAPWEGGFVWKKDKEGNPFVAVACEDDGAKTWLPIKMYLGDEPDSVSTHYTVPNNLMAISNGNLISVDENNNNTKTYHWKTSYSINPYNITFYIGNYKLIETDYNCIDGEKMSLKYYVLPQSYTKATTHFEQAKNILSVYESLFGKYPWPKDGFKLVESPYAGMEHQTAIAYGNGYKNEKGENYDYIILHETAHEWWGNAVSVSDFSDLWIHEGIATYAEALYVERTKSYSDYINYTYWTALTVHNKKPVIGPKGVYYTNYKDGDIYNKGAIMLHTLRNHLDNDSLFFNILKTFFKDYCYKMANTDDFVKIANQLSKQNLTPFFNHYLYKRYSPMLRWNFDYDNSTGKSILIYKLTGVSSDVNLKIHFKQGDKEFSVIANSELQSIPLPYHGRISVEANTKNSYVQDGFGRVEPSN